MSLFLWWIISPLTTPPGWCVTITQKRVFHNNDVDDVAIKIKQFLKILLISSPKTSHLSNFYVAIVAFSQVNVREALFIYITTWYIYTLVMQNIDETSLWIIICRWLVYFGRNLISFPMNFVSVVIIMTSINDWMTCFSHTFSGEIKNCL